LSVNKKREAAEASALTDGSNRSVRQIEDAAAGVLARPDHFFAVVKQIVEEEAPVGAKTDRIKQLRGGMLGEIEGLL
jgi:hypothetical protein